MKYALPRTVALAYHHDLSFIHTYVTPISSPEFISLYLTSLHCIFYDFHQNFISPDLSFLTIPLKLLDLQDRESLKHLQVVGS
jgi:hypothetical protein